MGNMLKTAWAIHHWRKSEERRKRRRGKEEEEGDLCSGLGTRGADNCWPVDLKEDARHVLSQEV